MLDMSVPAAILATALSAWQAYLLRRQLEQGDLISRAEFYQRLTRAFSELNLLFVERPDLRRFFYADQDTDDPIERQRLLAVAGYIADIAESCIAAESVLPHLKGDWDDHFNFLYKNSPVLREWWSAMGHLYPDEVKRAIIGPSARPKKWPTIPAEGSSRHRPNDRSRVNE
jgi:hypothetical protein